MSINIYRNRLNQEMKSFGKFTKYIYEECSSKGNDVQFIYSDKVQDYKNSIKENCTMIIVAHGSEESIFHKYDHDFKNHQYFLKSDSLNCLNKNKIIAISCGCARKLGPKSVESGACTVFLGFYNSIHFDKINKKPLCHFYEPFLKSIYKNVFLRVLSKAINEQWTFEKLSKVLEWELKKEIGQASNDQMKQRGKIAYFDRGIDQAILAVSNVASSIRLFGNVYETVS